MIRAVVDTGDYVGERAATTGIQNLDANQRRFRGNTLNSGGYTAAGHRKTRATQDDPGHIGTVSVVVLGITVIVDEIPPRGGVDPISVHEVVRIDPGVEHAHPHTCSICRESGTRDLALQGPDQRGADRQVSVYPSILFDTDNIRVLPERLDGLVGQVPHIDNIGQDLVLVVYPCPFCGSECPHGAWLCTLPEVYKRTSRYYLDIAVGPPLRRSECLSPG